MNKLIPLLMAIVCVLLAFLYVQEGQRADVAEAGLFDARMRAASLEHRVFQLQKASKEEQRKEEERTQVDSQN